MADIQNNLPVMKSWIITKDTKLYAAPLNVKGHLIADPSNIYLAAGTNVVGSVVYVRSAEGFTKMIVTKGRNNYKLIPDSNIAIGSSPVQTNTSSFSGSGGGLMNDALIHGAMNFSGEQPVYFPYSNGGVVRAPYDEGHSNTIGSWFKEHVHIGKNKKDKKGDDTKVIYTEEEAQALFKQSGSKKSFRDWIKKDGVPFISNAAKAATDNSTTPSTSPDKGNGNNQTTKETDSGSGNGNTSGNTSTNTDKEDEAPVEVTIMGMTPITFVLVGVGVISVVALAFIMHNRFATARAATAVAPPPAK